MLFICSIVLLFYVFVRLSCYITRSSKCLIGKTALVTGANSGIGYQTVLNLASRGCRVIMADVNDMTESKANIIKYTNNNNIVTKKIDLSSFQSVREFATDIKKSEERLDILINNAGIFASDYEKTEDGLHPIMQVNFFSHFLLTHLLIDLLKKFSPSRILFTTSAATFFNNLTLENFNYPRRCQSWMESYFVYSNSKLALITASDILAKKLKGTGVTSNAVHPGFVTTPIYHQGYQVHNSLPMKFLLEFSRRFFGKDAWEGSQGLVDAAVSNELVQASGNFLCDGVSFFKPRCAYDEKFCRDIWNASEVHVKLKPEEKL